MPTPQRPMPTPQKPMPTPQKPMPTPQKPMPIPQRPMPVPQKPMPTPQRPMPTPQKPMPTPQRPMPTPQKPMPTPQKPMPTPQKPMPTPQKPMPTPQKPMPTPQKPMPTPQKPMPNPQKPMPIPQRPMPVPQKPMPTPQRPLPTPQKKVVNRLIPCILILLCGRAAALSDEECAAYHELRSLSDYETFAEDCEGKRVLGFDAGVSNKFYAGNMEQKDFNRVFANAEEVSFFIYIENTDFTELRLPKLVKLNGGLSIRNNLKLKRFEINRGMTFDRSNTAPTTVTVDGNPVLDQESYEALRHLCSHCDIFEWTKCSALDQVTEADYQDLVNKCAGERIIKQKPGARFYLNANKFSEEQFAALFSQATHIEMCINFHDMPWKSITFPRLVRLIPCGLGDPSLDIVHNYYLTSITLPSYNSEGYGRLNPMLNVVLKNNFVLPPENLQALKSNCRFCQLLQYKECDNLKSSNTRNATNFVDLCGGKRIMWPAEGHILRLDLSRLSQELVDELFADVEKFKMCITLRNSQIKRLRMPKLKEMHSCEAGVPALYIEGMLEDVEMPETATLDVWYHGTPPDRFYSSMRKCKTCVVETDTKCGFGTGYTSLQEVLTYCMGARRIVYEQEVVLTETQLQQLCANAVSLKMCITVQNTSFRKISCPYLQYIEPCQSGKSVFTVVQNPYLIEFDIPETVQYPPNAKILTVLKNMRLPKVVIDKLKRICPHCDIEAYLSKCGAMQPVRNVADFITRCAGQPFIFPENGVSVEVDLSDIPEDQLNALFSEVTEMQICIRIKESQFRRLSFPKLTKWTPCEPGKPSLDLLYNFELRQVDFPSCKEGCVVGAKFQYNPRVTKKNMNEILAICDQCTFVQYVPSCGLAPGYSMLDFVRACAGQSIIIPEGEPLVIDARKVPEELLNLFCSRAVYMEVCILMTETQYRSLSCPYLREVKPCQSGMPVFTIIKNPYFKKMELPEKVRYPPREKLFHVKENVRLPKEAIERLKKMCPHCEIEGFYSKCAGIGAITNVAQFVEQCIGQPIITPAPNSILEMDLSNLPEEQINALFAEVSEIQMCITISQSWIKRLSFPKLERWTSCADGRPALTLRDNFVLEDVTFPKCEVGCVSTGEIRMNPKFKRPDVDKLLKYFMQVIYEEYVPSCGLGIGGFTDIDFVAACAGKPYIKPEGVIMRIDARKIPETAMEAFCSKAVYMEVCIIMSDTGYRNFRCPALKYIQPCSPGTPVFTIVHNPLLSVVEIPPDVRYPPNEKIMRVTMNRMIPVPTIEQLKKICPHCEIMGYFSKCSALGPITDVDAFLEQCAGQPLIAPRQGAVLEVDLSKLTDEQLNRLFSEVVEMQICVTIERSQVRSLEFPQLISWETCAPGKRPLTIRFTQLEHLRFPKCKKGCMRNALIDFNWQLPKPELEAIQVWCENCQVRYHEKSCGLTGSFSMIDLVRACAGKELIISDRPIIIHSDNVTEAEMNAFCSKAVYMQACIIISASNYKQLRCPNLEEVKPCRPGQPVFTIMNNMDLQNVEIPENVIFPPDEKLVEIYGNPDLPPKFMNAMKKRCPNCRIEAASACGLTSTDYTDKELAQACAGKTIIRPAKGFYLTISSRYVTEEEMNLLCSRAVHMEICIIITESHFKSLRCPYLKVLKPCLPDRPAIMIVDNPFFETLEIPTRTTYPPGFPIMKIEGNPMLHPTTLNTYKQWCKHCDIQPDYACGITRPQFTTKELVEACAGRKYIKPARDVVLAVNSKEVDEEQMNRLCSRAVYMQICIEIDASDYKMLKCPNLKELRSCQPGRPAIKIINNRYFQTLYIPPKVDYKPENSPIVEIYNNPSLDPSIIPPLKQWCPHCRIELEYACGITKRDFTMAELIAACTGREYIRPPPGMKFILTPKDFTEEQLNKMLENAVYVEACIEIKRSTFRRLRMPNLKEIRSCEPGRPAIWLEYNAYMEEVMIPPTATYPRGEQIIQIQRLPSLPYTAITDLQRWCPHCSITPDFVCGISKKPFTLQQVLSACTGQEYIMSARGVSVVVKSSQVTEEQMNELVARAKVMKICIEITRSRYKKLVIPKLRELLPCKYGQPAIKIVENPFFTALDMPPSVEYPKDVAIVEIRRNPHFDIKNLEKLTNWCPHCTITGAYACGLNKPDPSAKELMAACAGKRMVVPFPGSMINIHSDDFTEQEFNAFCSKVIHMQACITIEKSAFRKISCPALKELIPCKPGMPALRIVENFNLLEIVISPSLQIHEGVIHLEVRDNPRLPITVIETLLRLCPGCRISFDADCGLTRPFTLRQLVKACAGKVVVRPSVGHILEFGSDQISEEEMNAICSRAGYIEACITIVGSNYKSFQCPHLRELHPCAEGRVAITVEDNSQLTQLFVPISIAYPRGAIILQLSGNPLLPYEIVDNYRTHCKKACRFPKRNSCILQARDYRDKELISQCAGKSVIKPQKGFKLMIDSRHVTEKELNALCGQATLMEICIIIKASTIKSLECPVLREIRTCKQGTPAIQIIDNIDFTKFMIPKEITWPQGTIPYMVYGNPLTSNNIVMLQQICPQCKVSADYDCGLTRPFTVKQLVAACVGKTIIRPTPGHILEFTSEGLTEAQMNAFCHKAVYMEVCITISNSNFQSFRCPNLKELRPCALGRAPLTIYNNKHLKIIEFPKNLLIAPQTILQIYDNPVLSETWLTKLRLICKNCRFPLSSVCNLEARPYSDKELVAKCAGKSIIRPQKGFALTLHSKDVTEEEMNAFCSKATVLEICITIEDSSYTALRCPHLKELIPCQPGMPAIKIINNLYFSVLEIPQNLIVPRGQVIFEISENPHISQNIITIIRQICPWCRKVTANVACDLEGRHYSDKELVAACAGKRIIKPAPGWLLKITSRETTEAEMNALCSKAVYMEICIEITHSSFKKLRCPYLKELRPCQPGRPAIKIVNNMNFELLELPTNVLYPQNYRIIEISEVPHMRTALINKYIKFCRNCKITANLGCGLTKKEYSDEEMVAACAGKSIIKPAEGYMLIMNSDTVSEEQMNAVCSKAVYMEICIEIKGSQFRSLRCPYLRHLIPCRTGKPAIKIIGNPYLSEVSMSKTLIYSKGTKTLEIRGNPMLSPSSLRTLKKLCPECIIRKRM